MGDLISRGKFLMQSDPREINTTGLITGGTTEEEFTFPIVEECRLKRNSVSPLG